MVLLIAGWALLVLMTVGPVFAAQKHEGASGWTWVLAALLFGPLAGFGYYASRHGMRKAAERNGAARLP